MIDFYQVVLGIIFVILIGFQFIHWINVVAKVKIYRKNKKLIDAYKSKLLLDIGKKKSTLDDFKGYE
jgi:hypothetical protein